MKSNQNNNRKLEDDELLSSLGKENCFSVPDGYFDTLPSRISDRVASSGKTPFLTFKHLFIFSFSLAVAVLLLFLVFNKPVRHSDMENMILSDSDISQILSHPDLYNINENNIIDYFSTSDIENCSINDMATISTDEITSYLEEDFDSYKIINEIKN